MTANKHSFCLCSFLYPGLITHCSCYFAAISASFRP